MNDSYARAPHSRPATQAERVSAALLIDFDNVTMGVRSNLGQELRNFLDSDIVRGKVAVQRAYADWRRYPQYIEPLSESSIDLIFAPAYGSSKKNATDIRLAIDALELVFIRPEIGTFILLSGDSDFSSLVLKLKEYGKYVIGVGLRESTSDILVQNCDEYYSYNRLSGLTSVDEAQTAEHDPWELTSSAVARMVERGDVMRSDRLKQVMLEIDPKFDEKSAGFSKFNRFLGEAAQRELIVLRKAENGQYDIAPLPGNGKTGSAKSSGDVPSSENGEVSPRPRSRRTRRGGRGGRSAATKPETKKADADGAPAALAAVFDELSKVVASVSRGSASSVRDSVAKRKLSELNPSFDERAFGFSKFSHFLQAAHDAKVVRMTRDEHSNVYLAPGDDGGAGAGEQRGSGAETVPARSAKRGGSRAAGRPRAPSGAETASARSAKGTADEPAVEGRSAFSAAAEAARKTLFGRFRRGRREQVPASPPSAAKKPSPPEAAKKPRTDATPAASGTEQRKAAARPAKRQAAARQESAPAPKAVGQGGRERAARAASAGDRGRPAKQQVAAQQKEDAPAPKAVGRGGQEQAARTGVRGRPAKRQAAAQQKEDAPDPKAVGQGGQERAARTAASAGDRRRPAKRQAAAQQKNAPAPGTSAPAPRAEGRSEQESAPAPGAAGRRRSARQRDQAPAAPAADRQEVAKEPSRRAPSAPGQPEVAPRPRGPATLGRFRSGSRGRKPAPQDAARAAAPTRSSEPDPAAKTTSEKTRASGGQSAAKRSAPARAAAPATGGERAARRDGKAAAGPVTHMVRNYPGVGKRTAERLYEHFGEDVFQVIDSAPERLVQVLSAGRAKIVVQAREAERES